MSSILPQLVAEFETLVQASTVSPTDLRRYIKEFPHHAIEKELKPIRSFFHRQWIRISLRAHLLDAKSFLRNLSNVKKKSRATSWIKQAERLFAITAFFTALAEADTVSPYRVTKEQLQPGDIVLSYKTHAYLKKSYLSWLVRFATNSPVTHVYIACHEADEPPELLVSGDVTCGLGLVDPNPVPGEIYLILRPTAHTLNEQVRSSIREWRTRARNRTTDAALKRDFGFPELKCQTASLIGLFTVCSCFLGRPLLLPNPFRSRSGYFCSELIDTMFAEAGFPLTPRSFHSSVVGPVELLYSPYFELKHILCHDADLAIVQQEIQDQFRLKS